MTVPRNITSTASHAPVRLKANPGNDNTPAESPRSPYANNCRASEIAAHSSAVAVSARKVRQSLAVAERRQDSEAATPIRTGGASAMAVGTVLIADCMGGRR